MQSALHISHTHETVAFMPTYAPAGAASQAEIVAQVSHDRRDDVSNPVEYGVPVSLNSRVTVAS